MLLDQKMELNSILKQIDGAVFKWRWKQSRDCFGFDLSWFSLALKVETSKVLVSVVNQVEQWN